MSSFLGRQPFNILAAIGLLSVIDNIVKIPGYLQQWVGAWREVTGYFWETILFDISLPLWLMDYLSMGIICAGAITRYEIHKEGFSVSFSKKNSPMEGKEGKDSLVVALLPILITFLSVMVTWGIGLPIFVLGGLYMMRIERYSPVEQRRLSKSIPIFYETFIYALLLIAVGYMLQIR